MKMRPFIPLVAFSFLITLPVVFAQESTKKIISQIMDELEAEDGGEQKEETEKKVQPENQDCADCNNPTPATVPTKPPSIAAQNKKITTDCAATIPPDKADVPTDVDYTYKQLCKKPDFHTQGRGAYSVLKRKSDQMIEVRTSIRVQFPAPKPNKERMQFMFDQTKACNDEMNKYWHSYGIDVKIDFDTEQNKTIAKPLHTVKIIDDASRAFYADEYHFKGFEFPAKPDDLPIAMDASGKPILKMAPNQGCVASCKKVSTLLLIANNKKSCEEACEPIRHREYCLGVMHEVGHLLGLPDEYKDDTLCVDRPANEISNETAPFSAMAMPHYGFFDSIELPTEIITGAGIGDTDKYFSKKVEFMPRHVERILKPLCTYLTISPVPSSAPTPVATPAPEETSDATKASESN